MSASAYSLSLAVPADGFAVIQGAPAIGGLHGPEAHHFHCPHCMSWMFTRIDGLEQLVNLRPTMLDDHGWYVPYIEFFTAEKLPWAATPARHSFETAPDPAAFGALIDEYAREGARPGG
jgi:hypothetical protein